MAYRYKPFYQLCSKLGGGGGGGCGRTRLQSRWLSKPIFDCSRMFWAPEAQ